MKHPHDCACCTATLASAHRRTILQGAAALAGAALLGAMPAGALAAENKTKLTPDEALKLLKEGNEKFLSSERLQLPRDAQRRLEIARGQTPLAALLGCSDSRVPPELLFGRGLGELFIVRNAGNTVDAAALGSIEYGVAELGVPLIVVLGHERCGAVAAAVSVVEKNATFPGSIGKMIEPIIPAVLQAKSKLASKDADLVDASVRENVRRVVTRLRSAEPMLIDPIKQGKLKVVGARYDLDDGKVDFFET